MKGNMLIFVPLCLILCWMQPAASKKISFVFTLPKAKQEMTMVEDAVDDMYSDCNKAMTKRVKDKYFKKENTGIFADVWKKAEQCAKRRLEQRDKGDEALTKDHMQAICVYTSDYKKFYKTFNEEVRTKRQNYTSDFRFHSLHFWLTSAIHILNNNRNCHTTYRRSNDVLTGNVHKIIRFGFFASSSKKTDMTKFGTKTCFKIKTCFGAFLKKYPHLKDAEQEVLIPPYEKFKIRKPRNKFVGLSDCEAVYILESAGVESNLDCTVAH